MATALENLLTQLGTTLSALTGLTRWYNDPPESISEFPAGMAYSRFGEMSVEAGGQGRSQHTVVIDIYNSRVVAPDAIDAAKVWPDRVHAALAADMTLGGYVANIVWPMRYTAGVMPYNNATHYGVRFEVTYKVRNAVTTG